MDTTAIISTGGAALSAVVAVLWRVLWQRVKEQEKRQDDLRIEAEARHQAGQKESRDRHMEAMARVREERKQTQAALERCEDEHRKSAQVVLQLTASVARLEGVDAGVRAVTAEVLERIDRLRKDPA